MPKDEIPVIDRSTIHCKGCFFLERARFKVDTGKKHDIPKTLNTFVCRRFPPRVPDMHTSMPFPVVDPDHDWCGEFSPYTAHARMEETHGQEEPVREQPERQEVG